MNAQKLGIQPILGNKATEQNAVVHIKQSSSVVFIYNKKKGGEMDTLDLIAGDNFIPLNKTLAKTIGLNEAILFGTLCGYQRQFKGEEFYREQEKIIEDTCLTEYLVRNATKRLLQIGLITLTKKGLPAKYYYKINMDGVLALLTSSGTEIDTTGGTEIDTTINNICNNTIFNTNNKNININIDKKEKYKKEKSKLEIYNEIFNFWNEKNIIIHRFLTEKTIKAIDNALKTYTCDEIKTYIDRYDEVIKYKNYFFNTKWTLGEFLTQSNAIGSFTDEGGKWLNFKAYKEKKEQSANSIPQTYSDITGEDATNYFFE